MAPSKDNEVFSRRTFQDIEASRMEAKVVAMEKAAKGEKVYYKNERNPSKFISFLKNRLPIWERQKDSTFYGKRMHEKTEALLQAYKDEGHDV